MKKVSTDEVKRAIEIFYQAMQAAGKRARELLETDPELEALRESTS